jgi:hypothetical protein
MRGAGIGKQCTGTRCDDRGVGAGKNVLVQDVMMEEWVLASNGLA